MNSRGKHHKNLLYTYNGSGAIYFSCTLPCSNVTETGHTSKCLSVLLKVSIESLHFKCYFQDIITGLVCCLVCFFFKWNWHKDLHFMKSHWISDWYGRALHHSLLCNSNWQDLIDSSLSGGEVSHLLISYKRSQAAIYLLPKLFEENHNWLPLPWPWKWNDNIS